MPRFNVVIAEPNDDDEYATITLRITADSMEYDDTGILEFSMGPAGSARIVATFAPTVWLWAAEEGAAQELED
jgi:hypothetical protein